MFEAMAVVCAAGICGPLLLPGHEAATQNACEESLRAQAPQAASASCQAAGPALAMQEIAPGVFVHRGTVAEPDAENGGDVANLGFIVGETSVAVVDTGGARAVGEALWRAIRAETDLPVSHVVLTHMHPDHVFGASVFAEAGAGIVGHAHLGRALADRAENYLEGVGAAIGADGFLGTVAIVPDTGIEETGEIDLGGRSLELRAWPTAHTGTDLTVLDRTTGTLFLGDLLFDDHTPALDGSLRGWQAVLGELTGMTFSRVVPGHGGPVLDWPDGAAPLLRYLGVLEADTRAAVAAGLRMGEAIETIAASEAPNWALFEAYNPRNATVAFTELEWE